MEPPKNDQMIRRNQIVQKSQVIQKSHMIQKSDKILPVTPNVQKNFSILK